MKKHRKHRVLMVALGALVILAALLLFLSRSSLGVSRGRYLVDSSGTCLLIKGSAPIVLHHQTGHLPACNKLTNGDEILVLHDGIAESYPAQTKAYGILQISDGYMEDIPTAVLDSLVDLGWQLDSPEPVDPSFSVIPFPTAVSWANYGEESLLWNRALNRSKAAVSNIQHLPILRFDSTAELAAFKAEISETFSTQHGYDEVPSFDAVTAGMDEDFFAGNSLLLTYVWAGSCTWRYDVGRIDMDNTCLTVHVQRTDHFEVGDCAMAGWFITLTAPKEMLNGITAYDADLDNPAE